VSWGVFGLVVVIAMDAYLYGCVLRRLRAVERDLARVKDEAAPWLS
jgi:hypothetical protein